MPLSPSRRRGARRPYGGHGWARRLRVCVPPQATHPARWTVTCDLPLRNQFLSGFFPSATKAICARSRPNPAIQANQVHQDPRAGNTKINPMAAVKGNSTTSAPLCGSRSHLPSLTLTSHHFSQPKTPASSNGITARGRIQRHVLPASTACQRQEWRRCPRASRRLMPLLLWHSIGGLGGGAQRLPEKGSVALDGNVL
jgi:hypothetical protein